MTNPNSIFASDLPQNGNSAKDRKTLFEIQIWTIKDVSRALDLSIGHIYNLASKKMIPFYKKGEKGRLYFIPTEIIDWIKDGEFR